MFFLNKVHCVLVSGLGRLLSVPHFVPLHFLFALDFHFFFFFGRLFLRNVECQVRRGALFIWSLAPDTFVSLRVHIKSDVPSG